MGTLKKLATDKNESNMKNTIKVRHLKRTIQAKGYAESRADYMNDQIQRWKDIRAHAHTAKARRFCDEMVNMYLKRYIFYINGTTIVPVEETILNSHRYVTEEEMLNELNS